MYPIHLLSNIPIGTSLTPIFTLTGLNPGSYPVEMELMAQVSGAISTTVTLSFTGTTTSVNLNSMRVLAGGTVAVANHTSLGTTAGSAWIYAKVLGIIEVSAIGTLSIGATRTNGTSHTILAGSYINI